MQEIRFENILSMVDRVDTMADIGSDHGYVALETLRRNLARYVIATDISKKSLKKLQNTIPPNLQDRIDCRVGNGLEVLKKDEADLVVIAGMGGNLISQILEDAYADKFEKKIPTFVFQPVQNPEVLRKCLYENKYRILDEEICFERGKYYHIIKSKKDDKYDINYENIDEFSKEHYFLAGYINIRKKTKIFTKYIEREKEITQKIIVELKKNSKKSEMKNKEIYLKFLEEVPG